jgi:hypothetical protein
LRPLFKSLLKGDKGKQYSLKKDINMKQILCAKCNQALRVLVWDNKNNILLCDNDFCVELHAPVSNHEDKPPSEHEYSQQLTPAQISHS